MSSSQEVEIKFAVKNLDALSLTLQKSSFRLVTERTHEMNTLYDLPDKSLRRRGELLRLRQYGPIWLLTHKSKGKSGIHKVRTELETKIADGEKMEAILRALGYSPSFVYEKFRTEWADDAGHVVVDETPIGNFGVVVDETPIGNFGEIEGPPEWIDRTAGMLEVSRSDYITCSYAELFFDWKRRNNSNAESMTFSAIGRPNSTIKPK
jgi:adenylate cyclase, class 2